MAPPTRRALQDQLHRQALAHVANAEAERAMGAFAACLENASADPSPEARRIAADCHYQMGVLHQGANRPQQAYYDLVAAYMTLADDASELSCIIRGLCATSLAGLHLATGNVTYADPFINHATSLLASRTNPQGLFARAMLHLAVAQRLELLQEPETAKAEMEQALGLARECGLPEASGIIADLQKALGAAAPQGARPA